MSEVSSLFLLKSLVSGGVAGMAGKTFVAPLDRVKILMQTHRAGFSESGVGASLGWIFREEGFVGLFRGNGVQMLRVFPYGAIQFTSYEAFKRILETKTGGGGAYGSLGKMLAGSLGGVCGVVATYPLDTLRARLAVHPKTAEGYTSVRQAIRTVLAKEGGRGFYRGLMPSVLAIVPLSGLTFFFFELLKSVFLAELPVFRVEEVSPPGDLDADNDHKSEGCVKYNLNIAGKLVCGGSAGAIAQSFSYPLDVARRRMQLGGEASMVAVLKETYNSQGIYRGLYRGMSINYIRAVPLNAVTFSVYECLKQLLGISTAINVKLG